MLELELEEGRGGRGFWIGRFVLSFFWGVGGKRWREGRGRGDLEMDGRKRVERCREGGGGFFLSFLWLLAFFGILRRGFFSLLALVFFRAS